MKFATQNEQLLFIGLCILAGLLLISFVRIILLLRQRRKEQERTARLEKQILDQQQEVMAIRADSNAWRAEMQRQFDGFRAEASARQGDAEHRAADAQRRLDSATENHERRTFELQTSLDAARRMCSELPNTKARVIELEKMLAGVESPAINGSNSLNEATMKSLADAAKSVSHLPVLPSMETLETEDDASDGSTEAARASLAEMQQRNFELQRALLLARRRKPQARKQRGR